MAILLSAAVGAVAGPPTGWHAPTAAGDLAALRGAWIKPSGTPADPAVDLMFAEKSGDGLTIAVVPPLKPNQPDLLVNAAQFRLTAPGRMVVIRGDSAAEVRYRFEKTTLVIEDEFPAMVGDDRRLRFAGTYHRR